MKLKCIIRGIITYFQCGEFIPHIYRTDRVYRANVFYTDKSFRVSGSLEHKPNEKMAHNVYIEECVCIDCRHRITEWSREK